MSGELEEIHDIKLWIDTGEMNLPEIEVQLDWIIENGLAIVDNLLAEDKPEEALASFTILNAFLSTAAAKKPVYPGTEPQSASREIRQEA